MRSPSARVRKDRLDIYQAISPTMGDSAGGMVIIYPPFPTFGQVPCTIQAGEILEIVDEQDRITQYLSYKIMFARQQPVTPRDKGVYVDPLGVQRILFADVQRDEAGRGAAFTVRWTEKV